MQDTFLIKTHTHTHTYPEYIKSLIWKQKPGFKVGKRTQHFMMWINTWKEAQHQ